MPAEPTIPPDTRGIVSPRTMLRHVDFQRYSTADDALAGLIEWCWSVRYELPIGFTHRQHLIAHPSVNISVGMAPPPGTDPPPGPYPLRATVNGVTTSRTTRVLTGRGWNLAARTTVGGFGAWVADVGTLNDAALPLDDVLDVDADELADQVAAAEFAEGALLVEQALTRLLDRADPRRVLLARQVGTVAAVAEHDRTVRSVDQLAALAGVTARTLQRMFGSCAGVSPTWVIRRYRLIDAAERVRDGHDLDWALVAAELGYADQAHLTRDFTATIGQPPARYAKAQRS